MWNDFASVDDFKSDYGFYEMDKSTKQVMDSSYELMCIEEEFNIKGDFNTDSASSLMVVFKQCKDEDR